MQAVTKQIGVGLTHLAYLQSAANRNRFVILEDVDFQFTTLSYIIFSSKRELSPLAQQFLQLMRQARRLPTGKQFAAIDALKSGSVVELIKRNRKSAQFASVRRELFVF